MNSFGMKRAVGKQKKKHLNCRVSLYNPKIWRTLVH